MDEHTEGSVRGSRRSHSWADPGSVFELLPQQRPGLALFHTYVL